MRDWIKRAALVAVSVGLVVYLLRQTNIRDIYRTVANFPLPYLLGGFATFIMGHLVRAYRFKILLRDKAPLSGLFSIIAVQTAAAAFLPLRAGEFSLAYLLKKEHGVDYPTGAAMIMLAKAFDFLVVVGLFFISFASLPVVPPVFQMLLPWAGGLFIITGLSLFLMGRAREIYARLPGFFKEGPYAQGRFVTSVKGVFKGAEVVRSKKTLSASVATSAVLWTFLYGSNFFVLWGVGLHLTLLQMVFLTTSMSLFANLPIHSMGGFGTLEAFWMLLIGAMGVPREQAIATAFASHLVTIAYSLTFMLYGMELIYRKKGADADGS